jgi:large subunit ribosomal protein L5
MAEEKEKKKQQAQQGQAKAKGKPAKEQKETKAEAPREKAPPRERIIPRLLVRYRERAIPALASRFGYKNPLAAPRLSKIVLNIGLGEALANPKALDVATAELSAITGRKPAVRRAKKSISNFKLRAGVPIGLTVTLRGDAMYEFFDRLVNVAVPRIRDFRGLPPDGFDGRGNYTLGLKEQIIFPEIDYDKIEKIRGMNVTLATTASSDEEGLELLKELGVPFAAPGGGAKLPTYGAPLAKPAAGAKKTN